MNNTYTVNKNILNPEVQSFILNHLNDDLKELALRGIQLPKVSNIEVLEQIQGKKKAQSKLPEWFDSKKIIFPPKINLEQTSSSITAKYKASIIRGEKLIDLTGGFGVDTFFFSKKFEQVTHCEINEHLSELAQFNFKNLKATNIQCLAINGIEFLQSNKDRKYDWIYLDPARRDGYNKKVFQLKDTTPNILYHLEDLLNHARNILLKTSPLLDISLGIKHLEFVKEIHVVGINNEVKELLWVIEKNYTDDVKIMTINYNKNKPEVFDFSFKNESMERPSLSTPKKYLYEPNACIMKSGGFSSLQKNFKIPKLHINSHLYTSNKLMKFPGRIFEIIQLVDYNKKTVRKKYGKQKHNVATRNFTLKVSEIRHLFQIADGGDSYLFFTTNLLGKKIILECRKVTP